MKIEKLRPTVLRITIHTYEFAALMAVARWVAEGAEGDLTDEAKDQLEQVVARYDEAM